MRLKNIHNYIYISIKNKWGVWRRPQIVIMCRTDGVLLIFHSVGTSQILNKL